jgi:hypothetical protein
MGFDSQFIGLFPDSLVYFGIEWVISSFDRFFPDSVVYLLIQSFTCWFSGLFAHSGIS